MMKFKTSGAYQVATNSIKPVKIARGLSGFFLVLLKGDLYSETKQRFCFNTFDKAKRYAEMNVGVKMNWSDF